MENSTQTAREARIPPIRASCASSLGPRETRVAAIGTVDVNVRILVQVDDAEPVEIGAGVVPLGMTSVREGDRLVVKSPDPAVFNPALASILRQGADFFDSPEA